MTTQKLRIIRHIVSGTRRAVVVHDHVVVVHPVGDIGRDVNSKGDRRLGQQGLIDVAIRYPDGFPAGVIEDRQNLRDVYDLTALVNQCTFQDCAPERILINILVLYGNHGIRAGRHQQRMSIHTNALYLTQPDARKVDPIGRDLLREQAVSDRIKAVLLRQR
jgi:hypothetical protein